MKITFRRCEFRNAGLTVPAAVVGFGILEQNVSGVPIPGWGGTRTAAFTLPVQPPDGAASLNIASPRPSTCLNDIPGAQ